MVKSSQLVGLNFLKLVRDKYFSAQLFKVKLRGHGFIICYMSYSAFSEDWIQYFRALEFVFPFKQLTNLSVYKLPSMPDNSQEN